MYLRRKFPKFNRRIENLKSVLGVDLREGHFVQFRLGIVGGRFSSGSIVVKARWCFR